jgi:hypothetical protein
MKTNAKSKNAIRFVLASVPWCAVKLKPSELKEAKPSYQKLFAVVAEYALKNALSKLSVSLIYPTSLRRIAVIDSAKIALSSSVYPCLHLELFWGCLDKTG